VSSPAAWRLYSALRDAGHLDDSGNLALVRDLMSRWRAAAQRPQQRVGARWILPGRDPLGRLRASLSELQNEAEQPSACLGLFAACDALGVGHVRGVPVHLYVRHVEPELLDRLGVAIAPNGQQPDLLLRVARWPESLFRAVVHVDGVPVADAIQCWLDVSGEQARGAEQAAFAEADHLAAAAGKRAHDRRPAADVGAVADHHAGADPAFHHRRAERTGVEVDEALVHHGGAGGEVCAQAYAVGVGDAHAGGDHVVGHPRELVHAEHGQPEGQMMFGSLYFYGRGVPAW